MKFQAVRGTKDILPGDSAAYQRLEALGRSVLGRYGFQEIRTPTFEALELFQRSIGEETDIVGKEMYVFEDRGGRKIALRPEGTAGVVRAYLEGGFDQKEPVTRFLYMGPMFRAERPQAGRYREFWQLGVECFGNADPSADAESVMALDELLRALGLSSFSIQLNSIGTPDDRKNYLAALVGFAKGLSKPLCEDCQRRLEKNPLRILDCKVDTDALRAAPPITDFLSDENRAHFERVQAHLKSAGVPFELNPRLVRGLDYYTKTVFEVVAQDPQTLRPCLSGRQALDPASPALVLAAGGRYDGLVKQLGGPDTPAVGWALGVERVLAAVHPQTPKPLDPLFFVAAMPGVPSLKAFELITALRKRGGRVEGGLFSKSLKAQMRAANGLSASMCLIVGEDEAASGSVTVRNLADSTQKTVKVESFLGSLQL